MECLVDPKILRTYNNKLKTKSLFWEFRYEITGKASPVYTLRDRDNNGCISVYRIFMESDTEYECAMKITGSWRHWEVLCNTQWMKPEIEKWREERALKEISIGKKALIQAAQEGSVPAARYLADQDKRTAGRPTKLEVEGEKKRQAEINSKVTSIVERMKLA